MSRSKRKTADVLTEKIGHYETATDDMGGIQFYAKQLRGKRWRYVPAQAWNPAEGLWIVRSGGASASMILPLGGFHKVDALRYADICAGFEAEVISYLVANRGLSAAEQAEGILKILTARETGK